MFVSHTRRPVAHRRGAILIVVLAMLALFAVVGLSFVLYAESQASTARNSKISANIDAPPDAIPVTEKWLTVLLYGTDDEGNALRGHDLAGSKFGFDFDANPMTRRGTLSPFAGSSVTQETLNVANQPNAPLNWNLAIDRRQVVNFSRVNTVSNGATWFIVDPHRTSAGVVRDQTWVPPANSPTIPGTFANNAVPYTYPDRGANFFLAYMNPTTGEVVTPSFHRTDLFGTLAQTNPNWTSPQGRLLTLRPRPAEHPAFPFPQPNADGSITGDVSNLKFITGSQRNDSLWMDVGGPVLEWRGKKYKALVAPLILDLSGRVNLSVAGNIRYAATGTANYPRHSSNQGWGPHEVNPTAVFPAATQTIPQNELLALLRQRFPNPTTMTGIGAIPDADPLSLTNDGRINHVTVAQPDGSIRTQYTPLGQIPNPYGLIDPDGLTAITMGTDEMKLPQPGSSTLNVMPYPAYTARYPNTQSAYIGTGSSLRSHPTQFNPLQWQRAATAANHPFGLDDQMWLTARYTDGKGRYANASEAKTGVAPQTLADAQARALTTLYSTSQQWAEIPILTAGGTPVRLGPVDVNRPLPDYRKVAVWYNTRPMPAQYEPLPLSPLNCWDASQPSPSLEPVHYARARQARQNLARDIFVRLVALAGLVDGTNIVYDQMSGYLRGAGGAPNTPINMATLPATTQTALRQLAQYAANVVDFVDPDDISTAFVWNPANAQYPTTYADGNPISDPVSGVAIIDPSADPKNYVAGTMGDQVVFGTELPKLVINEAYSSLDNDRRDTATKANNPLKRRYWVELHNPLPADANAPPTGVANSTAAHLVYENNAPTNQTPLQDPTTNPPSVVGYSLTNTFNPYRLEVAVVDPNMMGGSATPYSAFLATNPANAAADTGTATGLPTNFKLQARIDRYTYDASGPSGAATASAEQLNFVPPANGSAGNFAMDNGLQQNGYYLVGPRDQFPSSPQVNSTLCLSDPTNPGVPLATAPVNALTFDASPGPGGPTDQNIDDEWKKTSVVILRRLANPYRPANDPASATYNAALPVNLYVTVDYLEKLPARDRVKFNSTGPHNFSTQHPNDDTKGTAGRMHPYAAAPSYSTNPPATTDAVQEQTVGGSAGNPKNSFFLANSPINNSRNGGVQGLEWLVHLDRQLINQLELLHVSAQSPALLTQKFYSERLNSMGASFAPTPDLKYQMHTVQALTTATANAITDPVVPFLRSTSTINGNIVGWHRALDLIVTGSHTTGIPVGGREAGKLNVNTMNDSRLLVAALDPQQGNSFTSTPNPAYAANQNLNTTLGAGSFTVWQYLTSDTTTIPNSTAARTPTQVTGSNGQSFPVPRATFDETGTNTPPADRPFKTFGGATGALGADDTLFRVQSNAGAAGVTPLPVFFNNLQPAAGVFQHPYTQAEPLRKVFNSLTPTSDSFLVVMTVGFFEVTNAGPYSVTNQPVLGKEMYERVPGDLRSQFAAVVDRSNLFAQIWNPNQTAVQANADGTPAPRPWQTKLVQDVSYPQRETAIVIEAKWNGSQASVFFDGQEFVLQDTASGTPTQLWIGYGDPAVNGGDGEWVTVNTVAQRMAPNASGALAIPVPGQVTITLSGALQRVHAAGTIVSNAKPGNPGPQTGVTLDLLRQRGQVPYFTRIDP